MKYYVFAIIGALTLPLNIKTMMRVFQPHNTLTPPYKIKPKKLYSYKNSLLKKDNRTDIEKITDAFQSISINDIEINKASMSNFCKEDEPELNINTIIEKVEYSLKTVPSIFEKQSQIESNQKNLKSILKCLQSNNATKEFKVKALELSNNYIKEYESLTKNDNNKILPSKEPKVLKKSIYNNALILTSSIPERAIVSYMLKNAKEKLLSENSTFNKKLFEYLNEKYKSTENILTEKYITIDPEEPHEAIKIYETLTKNRSFGHITFLQNIKTYLLQKETEIPKEVFIKRKKELLSSPTLSKKMKEYLKEEDNKWLRKTLPEILIDIICNQQNEIIKMRFKPKSDYYNNIEKFDFLTRLSWQIFGQSKKNFQKAQTCFLEIEDKKVELALEVLN